MVQNNKFALMALRKVLSTNYDGEISREVLSGRLQLDSQRTQAVRYFVERYSREKRHLVYFSRECEKYISSADYLRSKDLEHQFYWDFILFFEDLKEKMKEYRWSKEFLAANGIDFVSIKKLYFAVA